MPCLPPQFLKCGFRRLARRRPGTWCADPQRQVARSALGESGSPFLAPAGPSEQTPISHPARWVQRRLHREWGRLAAGPREAAGGEAQQLRVSWALTPPEPGRGRRERAVLSPGVLGSRLHLPRPGELFFTHLNLGPQVPEPRTLRRSGLGGGAGEPPAAAPLVTHISACPALGAAGGRAAETQGGRGHGLGLSQPHTALACPGPSSPHPPRKLGSGPWTWVGLSPQGSLFASRRVRPTTQHRLLFTSHSCGPPSGHQSSSDPRPPRPPPWAWGLGPDCVKVAWRGTDRSKGIGQRH